MCVLWYQIAGCMDFVVVDMMLGFHLTGLL